MEGTFFSFVSTSSKSNKWRTIFKRKHRCLSFPFSFRTRRRKSDASFVNELTNLPSSNGDEQMEILSFFLFLKQASIEEEASSVSLFVEANLPSRKESLFPLNVFLLLILHFLSRNNFSFRLPFSEGSRDPREIISSLAIIMGSARRTVIVPLDNFCKLVKLVFNLCNQLQSVRVLRQFFPFFSFTRFHFSITLCF